MMTPEQKFARWVRVSIAAFLGIFAWFIVADIWIPLTPDSTVMRVVTPVSSRVSGYVSHVYVHNNNQVKRATCCMSSTQRHSLIKLKRRRSPSSRRN